MKRLLAVIGLMILPFFGLNRLLGVLAHRSFGGHVLDCAAQPLTLATDAPLITGASARDLELAGVLCEPGVHGRVRALAFSPDETQLVSSGTAQPVRIWNLATGVSRALTPPEEFPSLAIDVAGRWLVAGGRRTLLAWDLATLEPRLAVGGAHRGGVRAVVFVGPDRFVTGGEDGKLVLWEAPSVEPLVSVRTGGPVWGLALSPDASEIASAGELSAARLRAADLHVLESVDVGDTPTRSAAYGGDGRIFLAGGGSIRSLQAGALVEALHTGENTLDIAFSAPGNLMGAGEMRSAVSGREQTPHGELRFWDPERADAVAVVTLGIDARVETIAFSPSGRFVAGAGDGGGIYIFSVQTAKNRGTEPR